MLHMLPAFLPNRDLTSRLWHSLEFRYFWGGKVLFWQCKYTPLFHCKGGGEWNDGHLANRNKLCQSGCSSTKIKVTLLISGKTGEKMDFCNSLCYFTLFNGNIKDQGLWLLLRKKSHKTNSQLRIQSHWFEIIGPINIKSNVGKVKLVCRMQICPFSPYNLRLENITYSHFLL